MAADILLYQTSLVPVGQDQKQHIELARDIAMRFNNIFGETFLIPDVYIPDVSAKIMSLQDPLKKMSKSSINPNDCIYLLDDLNVISKKIKKSVTDSFNVVKKSDQQPGVSNLLNIYCSVTSKTIQDAENIFKGVGYGSFKNVVADALIEEIRPIQQNFKQISADKAFIEDVLKDGTNRALEIALKTIYKVKKKVGFINI